MLILISWLDVATGPGREPGALYDIPVLLAAASFGSTGVLFTGLASTLLYHMALVYHHVPYSIADVIQTVLFFVLGLAVARLVSEYLRAEELRRELLQLNAQLEDRVSKAVAAEREAQQKLLQGQRLSLLGQTAAQIAHEIKNPLVSIGGFAGRIQRHPDPGGPQVRSWCDIIVKEVGRLEALLKELLHLGSPVSGEGRPVDLRGLVQEVLSTAQPPAQERGVKLTLSLSPEEALTITGDADHLRCALLNVVLNGVEAMPEGGELTVGASGALQGDRPGVSLTVRDTGGGFAPEEIAKVFEPFFTTKPKGTGLGLSVVKKTVDAHGGTVRVENGDGGGALVTLWFPAEAGAGEGSPGHGSRMKRFQGPSGGL